HQREVQRPMMKAFVSSLCALALVGCGVTKVEGPAPVKVGLASRPESVAFTCVTEGCDTKQKIRVSVQGPRRVAVKRIILSDDTETEFTFTVDRTTPFVAGAGTDFEVEVRYVPLGAPSPGAVELVLSYTDASPTEEAGRIPPGELHIPLVRRLVGQPTLVASPPRLSFGWVAAGSSASLITKLTNAGFGNVAVELSSVDGGDPELSVAMPVQLTLPPDAGTELSVTFQPKGERYLKSQVIVTASAVDVAPAVIEVEGTSLPSATLGIEPGTPIVLGDLPLAQKRSLSRVVVNQGGQPLTIRGVTVNNSFGNLTAAFEGGGTSVTLKPLERATLVLAGEGKLAGPVNATLLFLSNDSKMPSREVPVTGTITEPRLTVAPSAIDFGTVAVGWVLSKPVQLSNTGFGALTVKNIQMVAGSSNLYTLRNLPPLPFTLERGQSATLTLELRVETAAAFAGSFSVESDDATNSFNVVKLTALGGTCSATCAIANGTPLCGQGTCAVGTCNMGYFDTDKQTANGCECREIDVDPGAFCAGSRYVGVLKDNDKARANVTGALPDTGDVDLIRFYAEDAFALFSDNFDATVQLQSSDPDIRMCIYTYPAGEHSDECFFTAELCPGNNFYQRKSGGAGADGADILVKVFRIANTAPTCAPYTLLLGNGS
ncbi:MAG: choice-of-anchor D domain-containing protein, partial [Myxococcaceae bacterium]